MTCSAEIDLKVDGCVNEVKKCYSRSMEISIENIDAAETKESKFPNIEQQLCGGGAPARFGNEI